VPRKIDDVQGSRYGSKLRTFHDFADREGGDHDRFLEAASNACVGRRLFVTERGDLGLGPGALDRGFGCYIWYMT
jgi:hypothetical protein